MCSSVCLCLHLSLGKFTISIWWCYSSILSRSFGLCLTILYTISYFSVCWLWAAIFLFHSHMCLSHLVAIFIHSIFGSFFIFIFLASFSTVFFPPLFSYFIYVLLLNDYSGGSVSYRNYTCISYLHTMYQQKIKRNKWINKYRI